MRNLSPFLCLILHIIMMLTVTAQAEQPVADALRVGVIVLEPDDKASQAAEAVAVTLLPDLNAQPVERTELDSVLQEQALTLSAMSNPDSALSLGRALRADALLILEPNEQFLHARVMDTVHGVILAETLLYTPDPDTFGSSLRPVLARMIEKVRIPVAELVYVSVMGVTAAVDVEQLKALAGQLGPLIRADLQAIPNVRIVEREQLAQIARELVLAGGEAEIIGSAVTIEGELRPVNGGSQVEVALIITDHATALPASAAAEPVALDMTALRDCAGRLIRKHLRRVKPDAPVLAGPAEAATLLTRTYWRVMHQDYTDAEGRIEAALLIDDSMERLEQAKWVYYQLGVSGWSADPLLEPSRAIHAIRRHQDLMFRMIRQPSHVKQLRNSSRFYPTHFELALALAQTEEDWEEIDRIIATGEAWLDLVTRDRIDRGKSIVPLLRFRLESLTLTSATPEQYMTQAKKLIQRIRSESTWEDWQDLGDPVVSAFHQHFYHWYDFDERPDKACVRFGAGDVQGLFDWMRTQQDVGLEILANWYDMACGPEAGRVRAAERILELLYEVEGRHNSGESMLSADGHYPELAEDVIRELANSHHLGVWFDGFLDRLEASGDYQPLFNWYEGRLLKIVDWSDTEDLKLARLGRLSALVDRVERTDRNGRDIDALNKRIVELRERYADEQKHRNVNAWDQYEARPVRVQGVTDEMLCPDAYYLVGKRGDSDWTLYIAWQTREEHTWLFTRCPLSGGPLTEIGRGQLTPLRVSREPSLRMVVCGDYLAVGGVDGLLVFSQTDGSMRGFGPEQGLPGAFITSLADLGDRVIVGSLNGLSILEPATGDLKVIANALASESRSPLDRVPSYQIESIMTLNRLDRFWFTVRGNDADAVAGLWMFDVTKNEFELTAGPVKPVVWAFRGDILAAQSFEPGFFKLDPDANELMPYAFELDRKPWKYLLRRGRTPVVIGDHFFDDYSEIIDADGRSYMRFDHDLEWSYGLELNDNSVFLGYPMTLNDSRQPAMWTITRKEVSP